MDAALTKPRASNLELFRIITMLLIVAHHYVVLSDLPKVMVTDPLGVQSIFLYIFGAWGKVGINCFVLITGYFMCTSSITLRKFVKLVAVVEFYEITTYCIFIMGGVTHFSWIPFLKSLLPILSLSPGSFTSCYLLFFLFIPFLNILIHHMDRRQHAILILLNLFAYTFLGSIPRNPVPINYLSWFSVIYLVGSYIRLYPSVRGLRSHLGMKLLACIALSVGSIVFFDWVGVRLGKEVFGIALWGVIDSNKALAFITSVVAFCWFKNLSMSYHPLINTIAASAFGVLLIHSGSFTMMDWLWKHTLNNAAFFGTELMYLHAFGSVVVVYVVCTMIDWLRIRYAERLMLDFYDRHAAWCEGKLESVIRWVVGND